MHHLKNVGQINETFVDDADFINIAMPKYNWIEYIGNYSDTSESLCQFKRNEQPIVIIMEPLLILLQKILHRLNINQILLVVMLQMEQIEKKKV